MPTLHLWLVPAISRRTTYKPGLNSLSVVLGNLYDITSMMSQVWIEGNVNSAVWVSTLSARSCNWLVQPESQLVYTTSAWPWHVAVHAWPTVGREMTPGSKPEGSVSSCSVSLKIWLAMMANGLIEGSETWQLKTRSLGTRSFRKEVCEWASQNKPQVQGYLCSVWELVKVLFYKGGSRWTA